MKMKKTMRILLALVLTISCGVSVVSAEGLPTGMGGNTAIDATPEAQIQDAQNLTDAQKAQLMEKLSQNSLTPAQLPASRSTTWYYLNSRFNTYAQEAENFCGIACAQSAIEYLRQDTIFDQDTISEEVPVESWGTTLTNLKSFLNDYQTQNTYTLKSYQTTLGNMQSTLYLGVTHYDAPPIACIVILTTTGTGWPEPTNGHAVIVRGVRSDYSYFAISDPGFVYFGNDVNASYMDGRYTVSAADLHNAISSMTKCGFIY